MIFGYLMFQPKLYFIVSGLMVFALALLSDQIVRCQTKRECHG